MGIGPAIAIPAVLKKVNMEIGDIDVFEINEAFASQALYSVQKLGRPISSYLTWVVRPMFCMALNI